VTQDKRASWIAARLVVSAGALLVVLGSFLPWLRSGRRARSSYELLELAERFGFAEGFWARTAVTLWPFVPLLAVTAAVAAWLGWRVLSAVLAFTVAGYTTAVAIVVGRAPLVRLAGIPTTIAGAAVMAIGAAALVWSSLSSPS
jgi:hypothetical protein